MSEAPKPGPAETEQKARSREEAERRRAYKIEPPKAAGPPAPAAPPVTATPPPTPAAPPPVATSPTPAPRRCPTADAQRHGHPGCRGRALGRGARLLRHRPQPRGAGAPRTTAASGPGGSISAARSSRFPSRTRCPTSSGPGSTGCPSRRSCSTARPRTPSATSRSRRCGALTREEFLRLVRERLSAPAATRTTRWCSCTASTPASSMPSSAPRRSPTTSSSTARRSSTAGRRRARSAAGLLLRPRELGQAEPYLRQFLEIVARETGATSVSVIAHSMGNQLLLPVLRDLKHAAPPSVRSRR